MTGILYFVESRNPPVFVTPMKISFKDLPVEGNAFYFSTYGKMDHCNLSMIKKITPLGVGYKIQTRNSKYLLAIIKE